MDTEYIIASMIQDKMLELEAKGYSPEQADSAIKRARNWAQSIANKVPPVRREETFLDLFENQLNDSENWLSKVRQSKNNWKKGIEEVTGVTVGPQTEAAYQEWSA